MEDRRRVITARKGRRKTKSRRRTIEMEAAVGKNEGSETGKRGNKGMRKRKGEK